MTTPTHDLPSILDVQQSVLTLVGRPAFMTVYQLADFYGTTPKGIMQQVRRNPRRFPEDFWFALREDEIRHLVTQNALPNRLNRGEAIAFTRPGALALSGVLRTEVADQVSVIIIRAFTAMEQAAIRDARFMLAKLRADVSVKPIYHMIVSLSAMGLSFEQMWRATNYSRPRMEQAVKECLALGLIEAGPAGFQADLFTHG